MVLSVSAGQLRALRLGAQPLSGPAAIPVAAVAAVATLTVEPFTALPAVSADGLAAEAADIGRFLGADVTLEKVET